MIQAADGLGVGALAIQVDGRLFLTAEVSGIKVWDLETRTLLRSLPGIPLHRGVAWSGPDRFVVDRVQVDAQGVVVGEEPPVEYDLHGRKLRELPEGWRIVATSTGSTLIRAKPDGDRIVVQRSGGVEHRIAKVGCEIGTAGDQVSPTMSRDDRVVACVEHARGNSVVHVFRGDQHRAYPVAGWIDQLELEADGAHARVDAHDAPSAWGSVQRLDTQTGTLVRLGDWDRQWFEQRHTTTVTSPDGKWAATLDHVMLPGIVMRGSDGKVAWRWETIFTTVAAFAGSQIDRVYFTPNGSLLVVVLFSGELVLLEPRGGRVVARFGAPVDLPSPAFIPDPGHLVFMVADHVVRWDLAHAEASELGTTACETGAVCPFELDRDTVYAWSHPKRNTEFGQVVDPSLAVIAKGTFDAPPQLGGGVVDPDAAHPWSAVRWPTERPALVDFGGDELAETSFVRGLAIVDVVAEDDSKRCALFDLRTGKRHELAGFEGDCGQRTVGTVDSLRASHGTGLSRALADNSRAGMHFSWSFEPDHLIGTGWATSAPGEHSAIVAMWDRTGAHVLSVVLPFQSPTPFDLAGARLSPDGKTIAVGFGGPYLWRIDVATSTVTQDDFPPDAGINARWLPDGDLLVSRSDGVLERRHGATVVSRATRDPIAGYVDAISPDGSWFDLRRTDGGIEIWRTQPLALAATLVAFSDREYLAYTPDGYFTGSPDVGVRVAWVFDQPLEGFGFEQYAAQFRRPDVVAARLAGTQPAAAAVANRPPRISLSPPTLAGNRATLHVTATSPGRVDLVRAFVDGRPAAGKAVCSANGAVDLEVPIHSGHNRITVAAYDAASLGSRRESAIVTGPVTKARPKLWVVAVGVARYPKLAADQQLVVAADDARAIATAMRGKVAQGAFRDADVAVLLDGDASADKVLRALRRLDAMAPDDLAVIFFAGHGVKVGASGLDDRGDMMFLTSEASLAAPAGIRWTDVAGAIERARGRVVVLLDACHAGHFSRGLVVPSDDLAGAFASRGGALVFSASKGRQLSYEPTGSRGLQRVPIDKQKFTVDKVAHGLFTAALLDALDDADADLDRDGELALSEWIAAVSEQVARSSRGLQTPWVARNELHGDLAIGSAGTHRRLEEANAAHSVACDQVAKQMMSLAVEQAGDRVDRDDQLLRDNMRRARDTMTAACLVGDLPDNWRSCVMRAPTYDAARKCTP